MDPDVYRIFAHPKYWFMYVNAWPESEPAVTMAEVAHIFAPPTVSRRVRETLPSDVADLLDYVDLYAHEHPDQRIVWFSDVTRWLGWEKGATWSALDIDWERALEQLLHLPLLAMYLTISRRAYSHMINTARHFEIFYNDGTSEDLTDAERHTIHGLFAQKLDVDWPKYIDQMVAAGRLHVS